MYRFRRRRCPGLAQSLRPEAFSGLRSAGSIIPRRNLSISSSAGLAADLHQVRLGHMRRSVRQLLRQLAIVRQQQQPLAKIIEPANRIHARSNAPYQI